MANRVEIIVVAKDSTGPVFAKIESDAKKAGERAGNAAGSGIKDGIEKAVSGASIGTGGFESSGRKAGDSFGRGLSEGVGAAIPKIAADAGGALSQALGSGSGPIAAGIVTGLIGGAIAAAPLVASALAGAIIGGGVISAAVGGAILAGMSSPQVQQAGQQLGNILLQGLKTDASAFVDPLLESIDIVEERYERLRPTIQNVFDNAAQYVEPFTLAAVDAVETIVEAFDKMVEVAGDDVMAGIFEGMGELSRSIADSFERLGEVGPEAAAGIETAFILAGDAIEGATTLVVFLAEQYGKLIELVRIWRELNGDDLVAEGEWVELSEGVNGAKDAYEGLANAALEARDAMSAQHEEMLAQIDPVYAVVKAQGDLKDAQDRLTEATEKYGRGSQQANEAAADMAKQALELGMAVAEAGGLIDGKLTPAMYATLAAAGLTAPQIAAVEEAARAAKDQLDEYAGNYAANVKVVGADVAIGAIGRVRGAIDQIPDSKTVYVNVIARGTGLAVRASGGNIGGEGMQAAATGGVRGNMTLVGEQGPEIVRLPVGSTVFPAGQSRRMLADQVWEDAATQRPSDFDSQGKTSGNDDVVAAIRELGRDIRNLKLYINERVIGGMQGYEADLIGRAG